MVFDCHIHMGSKSDSKEEFARKMAVAGIDGGIIFSHSPAVFSNQKPASDDAQKRIAQVSDFTADNAHLYPFHWIDPLEDNAIEQVDMAIEAGMYGFKVICSHHYPQDDRAMKVWEYIAKRGKPILFHSGILYNDGPSCEYNRPGNFEYLFPIAGLKFALAHIAWPWCDELVAVFGKSNYLHFEANKPNMAEMYVDLTPGTPPIYREEALTKLITVGYLSMPTHMIFGTDAGSLFEPERVKQYIAHDNQIYDKLGVSAEQRELIFSKNMLAFLGEA